MAMINPTDPDAQSDAPQHNGFSYLLGRWWEMFKDYCDVLRPMRFCVLVWAAVSVLIILVPQSQDALLALLEDISDAVVLLMKNPSLHSISNLCLLSFFPLLAFFWAFQTFYWSRFVSRLPIKSRRTHYYLPPILDDARIERFNERIPRSLGAYVLFSVWFALLRANWWNTRHVLILTVMMTALLIVYIRTVRRRHKFDNAIYQRSHFAAFLVDLNLTRDLDNITLERVVKHLALWLAAATLAVFLVSGYFAGFPKFVAPIIGLLWIAFGLWAAGHIGGLPVSTRLILRVNILVFGMLFLVSLAPTIRIIPSIPIIGALSQLPSASIIMSVAAAWVFVGTFCLVVPAELLRLPITTFVILFGAISSFAGYFDNHILRFPAMQSSPGTKVESTQLGDAFDKWWADVPQSMQPVPLILVATAGGASRAAYWTTKVLTQIEQDHPDFHKYLFAISSVSGGSLGSVVFRTMLNDTINDQDSKRDAWWCPRERPRKPTRSNLVQCGLEVIDDDFLSPTFLTGLYADLTQRFLPGSLLPDRAAALERSWEESWNWTMRDSLRSLEWPFHTLWDSGSWLPALIINGTSEKTGRRIITSNLLIKDKRNWFPDAIDFFVDVSPTTDISVSTAADNSARFPYIDAAGSLITSKGTIDRIVDGGYFENFGAASTYDLLHALNSDEIRKGRPVKFLVIQIVSDPYLQDQNDRNAAWEDTISPWLNFASDTTAPPVSLFNTGNALGMRATEVLRRYVEAIGDGKSNQYAKFALKNKGEAMSWTLSRRSIDLLNNEWPQNNRGTYCKVETFMNWTHSPCTSTERPE
jgi:hypothetical protein